MSPFDGNSGSPVLTEMSFPNPIIIPDNLDISSAFQSSAELFISLFYILMCHVITSFSRLILLPISVVWLLDWGAMHRGCSIS